MRQSGGLVSPFVSCFPVLPHFAPVAALAASHAPPRPRRRLTSSSDVHRGGFAPATRVRGVTATAHLCPLRGGREAEGRASAALGGGAERGPCSPRSSGPRPGRAASGQLSRGAEAAGIGGGQGCASALLHFLSGEPRLKLGSALPLEESEEFPLLPVHEASFGQAISRREMKTYRISPSGTCQRRALRPGCLPPQRANGTHHPQLLGQGRCVSGVRKTAGLALSALSPGLGSRLSGGAGPGHRSPQRGPAAVLPAGTVALLVLGLREEKLPGSRLGWALTP